MNKTRTTESLTETPPLTARLTSESENNNHQIVPPMSSLPEIATINNTQTRIWVLSKQAKVWRECCIVDETEQQILIHYISFSPKYDEWMDKNDERIKYQRPRENLDINDNVSIYSLELEAWVEAEVVNVEKDKNRLKIMYVGVDKEEWLDMQSPRISIFHKNADDSYNGPEVKKI